jgi:anti-sigma B factor antagonist
MAETRARQRGVTPTDGSTTHASILRSAVVNDRNGITVLVEGDLDLSTGPGLYRELEQLLELTPRGLVLDLSRLEFIDSSGVSVLNTIREHALTRGVHFAIQSPSRPVERVLEITALWELFEPTPHRFEDETFEW